MPVIMRSDYLDTSNPHRLIAFFAYTNAANMATRFTLELEPMPLPLHASVTAVLEAQRQRAVQGALDLFDPYTMPSAA